MNNARVTKSQGHKVTSQHWCPGVVVTWCTLFVLILTCLVLPQARALAATYYVDIDGVGEDGILDTSDDAISSDTNPGTSEQPWKTLNRAYTWYSGAGPKVQEGDTVLFKNGSYGTFEENANVGSWQEHHFHRTNWITYKAATGHQPILTSIYIYNVDKSISPFTGGESYLIFDGFNMSGAAFLCASYIQVKNCIITGPTESYEGLYAPYLPPDIHGISVTEGHYITIEKNNISYFYRGIGLSSGDNILVKDNTIHYIGEDGISSVISYLTISGNHIYDINPYYNTVSIQATDINGTFVKGETVVMEGTESVGIFAAVEPYHPTWLRVWQTTNNKFYENGYNNPVSSTMIGQTSGAILSGIFKTDPSHSDGIQHQTVYSTDLTITNNIIHSNTVYAGMKIAAYTGGTVSNITVTNNLVYDTQFCFAGGGGNWNNVNFCNNTFYTSPFRMDDANLKIDNLYNNILGSLIVDPGTQVVNHGNNIFRVNPNCALFTMNDTEIISAAPGFVDAANDNFNLASSSVAINFGNPDYGPKTDILGNLRDAKPDAGAYEYGASTFLYGDVSGNKEISAYDAALTAQAAVDLITLTAEQTKAADVSGNGEVSAYDAALIAQRAVGLIEKFPVE